MKYSAKNPLVIALAIPTLFITIVTAVLTLSRLMAAPPKYDFIYSLGNSWNSSFEFQVVSGKVEQKLRANCPQQCEPQRTEPRLFLYEAKSNHSREISLEDASLLRLDPSQQSPDGYRLTHGSRGRDILFLSIVPSYDYSTMVLSGAGGQYPVNLANTGSSLGYSYGYSNSNFIGWVLQ